MSAQHPVETLEAEHRVIPRVVAGIVMLANQLEPGDEYGWKVARLFSRLEARVFRPAMAVFTANDAVLPFPLRRALDRVDSQLYQLIYEAFPLSKAS